MTTETIRSAPPYPAPRLQRSMLRLWHAWLAGGFLVAYVTAGEDTYAMHFFAGYAVLAALAVRLLAGLAAPAGSPWRLPRPSPAALRNWLATRQGWQPPLAWLAAVLLTAVGVAAGTGALADGMTWLENPHEAFSEAALWVIGGHVALMTVIYGGRRALGRLGVWLRSQSMVQPAKENLQ